MGSNKRYAEGNQRRRFNREAESRALVPRGLSEVERGTDEVKHSPSVPVKVWIDFGNVSVQVMANATAYTRRCVLVTWTDGHDRLQEAWVWAGAVERLEP